MTLSHDLVACIGEFVGTFLFLFLAEGGAKTASMTANAVSAASSSPIALVDSQTLVYVSLSFGLSLTVVAWMFFRVSGSLFNPAISLALLLAGALPWRRCILLVIAQFAGGIAANGMVEALTPTFGHSNITTLAPGVSVTQGIFLEAILTAALVFSVLMLAAEKHRATYLAPVGIGLTLFVCHLFGALWTGAAMNPARALGPSVIQRSFPNYHYVYYVGPFLGSLFALAFYIILKVSNSSFRRKASCANALFSTRLTGLRLFQGGDGTRCGFSRRTWRSFHPGRHVRPRALGLYCKAYTQSWRKANGDPARVWRDSCADSCVGIGASSRSGGGRRRSERG
ncbi:aquaporin-like protein [Tilletiaria anomala UBC 951]|uniref:Aquaporin-like protein n=1 Tax=Tilletiaria anomala (strain ATCC 24038 / CBS 436.72 / UBC 951) TaxID=1037660 RepID=A0A066VJ67_TILAU|nr:aquaporin-like protein [Tilletiaria anomala UBC 951]KDN41772.1 aquaporin-like protein [Tilletiaria anomala UBC 951]